MKKETKKKLAAETIAALSAVIVGVIMGEGNFWRNLISGIIAAIVIVFTMEWYLKRRKN